MAKVTVAELAATLERLQAQMAEISERLAAVEKGGAAPVNGAAAAAQPAAPAPAEPVSSAPPADAGLSEEQMLAIAAAIGAFLGVRAKIKGIRLISTTAWAQQGRVSIQASHRLQ
jgi:methylmalonyl-CoA carboxyltransferase large subunit